MRLTKNEIISLQYYLTGSTASKKDRKAVMSLCESMESDCEGWITLGEYFCKYPLRVVERLSRHENRVFYVTKPDGSVITIPAYRTDMLICREEDLAYES